MNIIPCTSCGNDNPSSSRFCSCCGVLLLKPNPTTGSSDLNPGTRLRDRYRIVRPLGRGGMGRTYLAEDRGRFNEWVTLKEMTPVIQGSQALQKAEELFQREAAILHKLSSPQIPRFWEFFREGRRLFLVQDYIEGQTYQSLLEERIAKQQRFSEAEMIELLRQLLPVLSYLHSLGIIHRDISPDNIICRASDHLPVLIDLGAVTQIPLEVAQPVSGLPDAAPANSTTRLGKLGYAPDEQLRLGIVAPHSDLYALAVTTLVLMTGKQPHQLIDSQTLNWVWQQELALSPRMEHILNRMLAAQPSERFHCADEVLQHLSDDDSGASTATQLRSTVTVTPQVPPSQPPRVNNSGQGRLLDTSVELPEEIHGWNWGAFFLPGLWCVPNRVWIGLVAWTDCSLVTLPLTFGMTWPIMAVILGVKGNEWAWKSRRWKSVKEFKRHQRLWAIAGFFLIALCLLLVVLILLILVALGKSLF